MSTTWSLPIFLRLAWVLTLGYGLGSCLFAPTVDAPGKPLP